MLKYIQRLMDLNMKKVATLYSYEHSDKQEPDKPSVKTPLDPKSIPKFTEQLPVPDIYDPVSVEEDSGKMAQYYAVDISEFRQQILPSGFPETTVWGYGGYVKNKETGEVIYKRSTPGPTFEATRGKTIKVKWINRLIGPHLFAVDPTLHWANPGDMPMDPPKPWPDFPPGFANAQWPVPVVTHLHGGETPSIYDGHPDAWFTALDRQGPAYKTDLYTYKNAQEPCTMWYHDHAMGLTRLNVFAGLAGFYLLRDPQNPLENQTDESSFRLPSGKYEIPLVIQDRAFYTDGSLAFNNVGLDPEIHPYWFPGFIGNAITVNGKTWPNLSVERRRYRFRLLNGSNDRFYHLSMSNGMTFTQIGTDGGYLNKPVELTSLLIAPAERADILIDFSTAAPGEKIIVRNDANTPYPQGGPADPETVGQIMQFSVEDGPKKFGEPPLPARLNKILKLKPDSPERILTLNDITVSAGPIEMLLSGQKWDAPITECPRVGSTEDWVIVNLMPGAHPVHLHLIQFRIVNRQPFNAEAYMTEWNQKNGNLPLDHSPVIVPVEPYLTGAAIPPDDNEKGWKDTARANPGEILRIRVRFAPQNIPVSDSEPGVNYFPFDPSKGPGYVYHCHILDHEDNEMMRPLIINP